jgi:hypothetical protein
MSSPTKKRKGSIPGAGFGMVGMVLSLAVVAVGGVIGGTALLGGSGSGNGLGSGAGSPADKAYDIAAESSLETAESAVETAATTSGYASIDAQSLEFDEPSVRFVSGPSTSDTTVSVVGPSTQSGGSPPSAIPGQAPSAGSVSSSGGSVTLAAYSESTSGAGSCLYVWTTSGATWFGAESNQTSCSAVALASAPVAGTPSSNSIGWAQSAFPNP